MAPFSIHSAAEHDLRSIASFISKDNRPAAARWVAELRERFRAIGLNPGLGHRFSDDRRASRYRVHVYGRYLIFYEPESSPVLILAVIHGMRSPETIRKLLNSRRSDSI